MQKGIRLNDGHVASLGLLARKDGTRKGYLSKRTPESPGPGRWNSWRLVKGETAASERRGPLPYRVRERRGACASSAKLGACEATGVASVLSTGGELPADPEPEQRAEGF
ncbi:hypothetical protein CB1_001254025 [Camelus ferus]|nr:hypothetical protein CB1_001254025 [Camelus ferus]